ncbi:MAG: preprotein translocase subunit SecG [Aquificae bacterium]|nr:preprotein translocase subunit SecG [Aquificota bacterium]
MELLYILLSIALVVDSILLIIIILMQKTKGAEIGAVFGSGAAAAVLGAGAANIITKITYWLGGIFLALVFSLTLIHHKLVKSQTVIESIPIETKIDLEPKKQDTSPPPPANQESNSKGE